MRPILREHTHDGRVVGDPLPLALGIGVEPDVVPIVEQALTAFLLPGELLLAIARVADRAWESYYVMTSHHFCRVALDAGRREARVLTCAYEHTGSGLVTLRLRTGEVVDLGPLAHPRDGHVLSSALSNMTLPAGSDARTTLVQDEPLAGGAVDLYDSPVPGQE